MSSRIRPTIALSSTRVARIDDVYVDLCTRWPDYVFAYILPDGGEDDSRLVSKSWGQLLLDGRRVSSYLNLYLKDSIPGSKSAHVAAILADSGYTYFVYLLGIWLSGWTVQPLSIRNSVDGLESLLEEAGSSILIADEKHSPTALKLGKRVPNMIVVPMSAIETLPPTNNNLCYPRRIDLLDIPDEAPAAIMHSSGTEGHPKLIVLSHAYCVADIRLAIASDYAGCTLYSPAPLYHGMGLCSFSRWSAGSGVIPVFVETSQPFTGNAVIRHLRYLPDSLAFIAPSLIEEIWQLGSPGIQYLRQCRRVLFGGAPINPEIASNLILQNVPLISVYGSSETSVLSQLDFPSANILDDWPYFKFVEESYEFKFVEATDTEFSELIVRPGASISPAVINVTEPVVGFKCGDLWEQHPTILGLWKHAGRRNDVTILSNGEKTDNQQLRKLLMEDKRILDVLVFGTGQVLNGVILRLDSTDTSSLNVNSIWPSIEYANAIVPKHSRVLHEMVLLVPREKQFPKSDKGTIQTKKALDMFKVDIEELYRKLAEGNVWQRHTEKELDFPRTKLALETFILDVCQRQLAEDADFFNSGLDSLDAIAIRRCVVTLTGPSVKTRQIPFNVAYVHSSISSLARYVQRVRQGIAESGNEESWDRLDGTVDQFTTDLKLASRDHLPNNIPATQDAQTLATIAITGSTGSLGCYVLSELLADCTVKKVYCLVRGSGQEREKEQEQLLNRRGVSNLQQFSDKVEFVSIDLSRADLGIQRSALTKLRSEVTHYVHLAWELNFNWTVSRFVPEHIAGTRHLLDLALSSTRSSLPRFAFLSSIGAVQSHKTLPVPAKPVPDPALASTRGYGQAKYIAERIIDRVAVISGLPCVIIRCGQLSACTRNGIWAQKEFIPMLLKSSLELETLPLDLPPIRWLPVDIAAVGVCSLVLRQAEPLSGVTYFHLENPNSMPWAKVAAFYQSALRIPHTTSLHQWIDLVESKETNRRSTSSEANDVPASRLLQFYSTFTENVPSLDVSETLKAFPVLERVQIDDAYVQKHALTMLS